MDTVLCHHGIKGQKWGVRRTLEELGHEKKESKHKNVKKMSDAELQERIKRLELEKRYSDLKPDVVNKAKKNLKDSVTILGGTIAVADLIVKLYNKNDDLYNFVKQKLFDFNV